MAQAIQQTSGVEVVRGGTAKVGPNGGVGAGSSDRACAMPVRHNTGNVHRQCHGACSL
jgi:hypothetical protein